MRKLRESDKFFKKGLMRERGEACFGRNYLRSNLKTLNQFVFEFPNCVQTRTRRSKQKKIKQKYLLKRPKSTEERIFFVWVKILKQCEAFYRELMKQIARTSIAQSLDIFVVRLKGGSVSFTQFTKFNALWWVEYLTKRENHKYICAEYQQNNMSSKTQNKKSKNIKQLEVIDLREKNSC